MNCKKYMLHINFFIIFLMLSTFCTSAFSEECTKTNSHTLKSLYVPLTIQLPENTVTMQSGAVLYKKEASLTSLIGFSKNIFGKCSNDLPWQLFGRLTGREKGQNVFSTGVPGVGLRLTFILDKSRMAQQVFVLPFRSGFKFHEWENLTTDEIKIRLEIVKIDEAGSIGDKIITIPSVLQTSDNSLIVGLLLRIKSPKSHCIASVLSSQINLPPVNVDEILNNKLPPAVDLGIEVKCSSAHLLAISAEGVTSKQNPVVYENTAEEHAAKGVGFEVFYNDRIMLPAKKYNVHLSSQSTLLQLPLSVRYVKLSRKINSGKVKAEITLHVNYL